MKRVMVVLAMLVAWAGVASACEAFVLQDGGVAVAAPRDQAQDAAKVSQPPPQPRPEPTPPPPPDPRPRRIGSMVGYIDDAIIESQVRVRFEVGLGNHAPDRAEFFYAKCGCYRDLDKFPTVWSCAVPRSERAGSRAGRGARSGLPAAHGRGRVRCQPTAFRYSAEMPIRWIQPQALCHRPDNGPPVGFGEPGRVRRYCEPARRWPSPPRPTTP